MMTALTLLAALAPSAYTMEITVMTYNIRYGTASDGDDAWPLRKAALVDTIRAQNPDVLGVQEALAFQLDELRQQLPGYDVFGVGRDDGISRGEFSAILYRRDRLGVLQGGTQWIGPQPNMPGSLGPGAQLPRVFTWAKFAYGRRKRIWVVNTHLDHQSDPARILGGKMIGDFLTKSRGGDPAIVMGDFNSGPKSAAVQELLRQNQLVEIRPKEPPFGTFTSFQVGQVQGEQIDHIFASPKIQPQSVTIDRRTYEHDGKMHYPSDHCPVVARLVLP